MENFKLVKEESFESISRYLNLIYKLTELENPLAFVDTDNGRYMITKIVNYDEPVDNAFIIAYEEDGEIKPVGVFYDDIDQSFMVNMGDLAYRVREDLALRENLVNGFKEQLSCTDTVETDPKKAFNYHQIDPINHRVVDMHYIVDGYSDPNMALPYLKNKYPKSIDLTTQKIVIPNTKSYILDNNTYYRYHRVNDDVVLLLSLLRRYSTKDMMEIIKSYGCNIVIPEDMVRLYFGENKDVKTLKLVADTYRKNTNL